MLFETLMRLQKRFHAQHLIVILLLTIHASSSMNIRAKFPSLPSFFTNSTHAINTII
jgi:hypothetical protein